MAGRSVSPVQPIRTLIVDDEPAAREGIRQLLRRDPEITLAGECANGREAAAAIMADPPDLVFLDVQMPELDGFGVLQQVDRHSLPAVVFVTAYDQYALKAFDVHAVDYLLKPFTDERFRESLERAKQQVRQGRISDLSWKLLSLIQGYAPNEATAAMQPPGGYLERLAIKSGGRVTLLRVDEIEWIDAQGDYVRIHVGKGWHLLRETMKNLEARLNPSRFVRIHRSTIVNLEKVKELQPYFRGDYVVVLQNGTTLKLSRGYRAHLEAKLGRTI
jgi:two-component system, LytTR family, response regulator